MIVFKEREKTDAIAIIKIPEYKGMSKNDIAITQLQKGKLNLGFHYIIREDGSVEKGIPLSQYGDPELYGYKTSIIVLIAADKEGALVKDRLKLLKDTYKLPLKRTKYE